MDYQQTKILVIEDEQYIRENIQELLEARGYKVRIASNGKQGVLEAIDFRPHLIVCDQVRSVARAVERQRHSTATEL